MSSCGPIKKYDENYTRLVKLFLLNYMIGFAEILRRSRTPRLKLEKDLSLLYEISKFITPESVLSLKTEMLLWLRLRVLMFGKKFEVNSLSDGFEVTPSKFNILSSLLFVIMAIGLSVRSRYSKVGIELSLNYFKLSPLTFKKVI